MIPLSRIHLIPGVKNIYVSKSVNVCRNLKSEFPIKILEDDIPIGFHFQTYQILIVTSVILRR